MKKYLALILALLMVLSCAACGSGDTTDKAKEGTGETELVLAAEESGEGFSCVLLDNGSIFWLKGVTSTAQLLNLYDLKDAPMAQIEVVGSEIRVIGDEIPDWLAEDEEMVQVVLDAMEEWKVAPEADLDSLEKPDVEVVGPTAVDAESTEPGRKFACAVLDNGHVVWEQNVSSPSELGEEGDNVALVQIIHLPNNAWEILVIGEIPGWFDDSVVQNVKEAFYQWMDADSGEGGPDKNDPKNQGGPDMNDPKNHAAVPANKAEAVGIYTFATNNSFGTGVQYALWLNGDGTAYIFYNSSFKGLCKYTAQEWTVQDGVASVGAATAEEGDPEGDMFNKDDGYTSAWVLNSDGTCVPKDWTGVVKKVGEGGGVGDGELPAEAYPAGAEQVGIYTFATNNSFGTGVQYALWLNGDGTAYIFYNSSFKGLCKYTAQEWTVNEDGTISVGAAGAEEGDPEGDMFNKDDGYTSTWVLNGDGTCVPKDWTGVVKKVGEGGGVGDGELPEEAYPIA